LPALLKETRYLYIYDSRRAAARQRGFNIHSNIEAHSKHNNQETKTPLVYVV
jgi:hypothetical protein